MAARLTILHLSDIQFGKFHRFDGASETKTVTERRYPDGEASFKTLLAKLIDDLDGLASEHSIRPNVIVLSGDQAEWSLPDEYKAAREFLEGLIRKLKIDRRRVVMVPGNHDVNWDLCAGARTFAKGRGLPFDEPYFDKFLNYQDFFNDFYRDTGIEFTEERLFHVYPFPEEQTLIVGFNSCIKETDEEHFGHVGIPQIRAALDECNEHDPEQKWLRIAVMHHNFVGASDCDNENLRDADEILLPLQKGGFRLLMHGHRHIGEVRDIGKHPHLPLKVVAAGSAGLDYKTLPEHPNQYQVIDITGGADVAIYMRQYSAQSFGMSGKGDWRTDTSVEPSGIVRFSFERPKKKRRRTKRKPATKDARQAFLDYLREEHRLLQLKGFGPNFRVPLELEPIYVSLRANFAHAETDFEMRHQRQPVVDELEIGPALDYCHEHHFNGMFILGHPGSGKTTLLQFLTLCLAQKTPAAKTGINCTHFPLFLPMRRMQDFDISLGDALQSYYPPARLDLPGDFFRDLLNDTDRPCLLLLDGFDEVATLDRRREALDWIEAQRKRYPHNSILVTSRFAGVKGETRLPPNYLELHIQDFRDDDVRTFVRQWYRQVETVQRGDKPQWREHAVEQSDHLLAQLFESESLLDLARNPLMLQIICLVHRTHGNMPRRRTELYEECIKVLLQKWDEAKGLEVYLTADEARKVLRPLALWLHEVVDRRDAEAEEVKQVIAPHLARIKRESLDKAEEQLDRVLTSVRDRSGLFVGYDVTRYGFQHLSFQEFLAAEEIVKQGWHQRLVDTFGNSWWQEPTLLSLGMDDPRFQAEFLATLLRAPQCRKHLDLALKCVRETFAPEIETFVAVLNDRNLAWQMRHSAVLFLREIEGPEAVAALRAVLSDGDQRIAVPARDALIALGELAAETAPVTPDAADIVVNPTDGSQLILIPAGEFLMGSDDADKDERPQHSEHVGEFRIAKTPVTNAQYRKFIEATGHREPGLWDDNRFNQPNQPVVGVTWHDAMAYCKWAGLRLPTEREWEKAARGTDGRSWPWGQEPPDDSRCNFNENVGATTEVGSYPDGASPYGCLDMAGNVWEWCVTKWRASYETEPDDSPDGSGSRVLRGGAYYSDADAVRCASRDRLPPDYGTLYYGFRCAQ